MTPRSPSSSLVLAALLLAACGDDDPETPTDACALGALPTAYPSEGFAAGEAAEVLTRFEALKKALTDPEVDLTLRPTREALVEAFEAGGAASLSALTSAGHRARTLELLGEFAQAAGQTWTPAEAPRAAGGQYGGDMPAPAAYWLFTGAGLDIRQVWEKGSFGALMYRRARELATGDVTPATVDAIVAYFGAAPGLANGAATPAFDRGTARYSALYNKRRDNPAEAGGWFDDARAAAIEARAAAAAGEVCAAERRAALERLFTLWEEGQLATVVFYAAAAQANLEKASPTSKDLASALHGIGEAIGFAAGFRGLPDAERVITDAQIDQILDLFGARPERTVTTYQFAQDPAGTRAILDQLANVIGPIYGFSSAELSAFESNF